MEKTPSLKLLIDAGDFEHQGRRRHLTVSLHPDRKVIKVRVCDPSDDNQAIDCSIDEFDCNVLGDFLLRMAEIIKVSA